MRSLKFDQIFWDSRRHQEIYRSTCCWFSGIWTFGRCCFLTESKKVEHFLKHILQNYVYIIIALINMYVQPKITIYIYTYICIFILLTTCTIRAPVPTGGFPQRATTCCAIAGSNGCHSRPGSQGFVGWSHRPKSRIFKFETVKIVHCYPIGSMVMVYLPTFGVFLW